MQEAAVEALEDLPDSLESAAFAAPAPNDAPAPADDVDLALDAAPMSPLDAAPMGSPDPAPLSPDNTAAPVGDVDGSAALARSSTTSSDPSTFDTIPFDFVGAAINLEHTTVPFENVASAASSGGSVGQEGGVQDRDSLEARILFLEYLFCIYSRRVFEFMLVG